MEILIRNITHYFVSLFAILLFLIANQAVFAVEYKQKYDISISKTGSFVESINLFGFKNGQSKSERICLKSKFERECKKIGKVVSIAAKTSSTVLSKGQLLRIENAATRINKPITVVGSRAKGKAGAYSDWDYVIKGLNSKNWSKIKNSLPGSRSILDNTPRNIDIFKGPVNTNLPHITIYPR